MAAPAEIKFIFYLTTSIFVIQTFKAQKFHGSPLTSSTAPLLSALEAPPHPPFLHLWRLCLQFPLFQTQTHPNQPLTFILFKHFHLLLHSLDASSPPPAQTYPSSKALSHNHIPLQRLVTPPPAYYRDVQMWEPQLARTKA